MKTHINCLLILATAILLPLTANGEEDESYLAPDEDPENYDIEELLKPHEEDFFQFLDSPHELISEGVEVMAQEMDLFFADEKIYSRTNNSYARINTQVEFNEQGESSVSGEIKLKIDLQKTKRKLKLLLESDSDRDLQTGTNQSTVPAQEKESTSFFAALQREISKKHGWDTKASLGVKLRVPLDPFLLFRANKSTPLGDWKMRFTETLFWFNSQGSGASSLLDFDYALSPKWLFRSRTSELWTNFLDYHEVEQSFSLFHELSDRRAISYTIGTLGISEPTWHNTGHYISLNYRQRIHRDWLFVEINPYFKYERENDYQAQRAIIFKLEMVFGNKYVYRAESEYD